MSAEATRSGGSRWARLLRAAGVAAAGPMHLGRQGRVSAEATRCALRGTVSPPATRFGCSGRLLVSAVRGPRNSRSPPGVAGSLSPRGARRAGGGAVTDTKALAKPLYRRNLENHSGGLSMYTEGLADWRREGSTGARVLPGALAAT